MSIILVHFNRKLVGANSSVWNASKSGRTLSELCKVDCICKIVEPGDGR